MSDRPDPAIDFVGSVRWLMEKMDSIERRVGEREERKYCASDAAKLLGYNSRYFHGKPWRIPNFAPSGTQFPLSVWKSWIERPDAERRSEWDRMPPAQRQKARCPA